MTRIVPLVALILSASVLCAATPITVEVHGAIAFGFVPSWDDENDDDRTNGNRAAQVEIALEELKTCVGAVMVDVDVQVATDFVLRDGERLRTLRFPSDGTRSFGIVLMKPGSKPVVVSGTYGPDSLQWLAKDAATKYFPAPGCKRVSVGDVPPNPSLERP